MEPQRVVLEAAFALITGLVFTRFQTPDLISDEDIIAAFEALAGAEPAASPWPMSQTWTRSGGAV